MPQIDLSFLLEDPSEGHKEGTMTVEPLAPLSMNTSEYFLRKYVTKH